jgi:opacity protein-like surface antigen
MAMVGAATLAAQSFEAGGFGGVSRIGSPSLGRLSVSGALDNVSLKDGWKFGFRMAFNNWRYFGHEVGYAYNRTQLRIDTNQRGMAVHQGMYNFLAYAVQEGKPVRPFVTGGGNFNNFVPPGASAQYGQGETKFGFNYGGGIKFKINHMWGARLDVRQYECGKPFDLPNSRGRIKLFEISAGVYIWM